jgi:hypothetical protein
MVDLVVNAGDAGVTYDNLLEASGWAQCRPVFIAGCRKPQVALTTDKTVKPLVWHVSPCRLVHKAARRGAARSHTREADGGRAARAHPGGSFKFAQGQAERRPKMGAPRAEIRQ